MSRDGGAPRAFYRPARTGVDHEQAAWFAARDVVFRFGPDYQWRGVSGQWRGLILVRFGDAAEWRYIEPGGVAPVAQWLHEQGETVTGLARLERAIERAAGVRRRR